MNWLPSCALIGSDYNKQQRNTKSVYEQMTFAIFPPLSVRLYQPPLSLPETRPWSLLCFGSAHYTSHVVVSVSLPAKVYVRILVQTNPWNIVAELTLSKRFLVNTSYWHQVPKKIASKTLNIDNGFLPLPDHRWNCLLWSYIRRGINGSAHFPNFSETSQNSLASYEIS